MMSESDLNVYNFENQWFLYKSVTTAGEHVEQLQDLVKDLEKQQYLPHY